LGLAWGFDTLSLLHHREFDCVKSLSLPKVSNYVSDPPPASFFEECKILEIHGENAPINILKNSDI